LGKECFLGHLIGERTECDRGRSVFWGI
jgi:hypothetical protein